MGSIYKITNTVNGKSYIGQTRHDAEKTRIRDHLTGNSKANELVKRAVEKYGRDAFTYEILYDGIIPELLDSYEIEAIKKFNTISPHGYNLTTGGGGGSRSEETCRKIAAANTGEKHPNYGKPPWNKGKKTPIETRRKQSEAKIGKKRPPFTDETRRKLSEANKGEKNHFYGKTLSQEHRQKLSKAITGKKHSSESKQKMSEVRESAECKSARTMFFSLPPDMNIAEKRKYLYQKFPNTLKSVVWRWCRKFDSEA